METFIPEILLKFAGGFKACQREDNQMRLSCYDLCSPL